MTEKPQISEAEWAVMDVLWKRSPISANDIVEALKGKKKWNHRTIRTLLSRLVKKNILTFTEQGKSYLYRPRLSRDACVQSESSSFLNRVFNGNATSMLLHLVESTHLKESDIEELRLLLNKKGE